MAMNVMEPDVMIKQVEDLANVTREQLRGIDHAVRSVISPLEILSLHKIFVFGDGDSFHGALASELAFESFTGLPCEPMSAMRFREYGADFMFTNFPNDTLAVGISASGGTARVAEALQRAAQASDKAITVALTGNPESRVGKAASRVISAAIPSIGASPGIRTYNATLMGLALLAIRIGEVRGKYHNHDANKMREEIAGLGDVLAATYEANRDVTEAAAKALVDAQTMVWLGSGPSFGTAMFSAAKVVEAAGQFAIGQDLEEWAHVERFIYPDEMPTFIIAPPGRSYGRAADLARQAKGMGRRIIAVVDSNDTEIASLADFVFPIVGNVREEFSPMVYHLPSNLFASHLATALGRKLFQTDTQRRQDEFAAMRAAAEAAASSTNGAVQTQASH